MKRAASTLALAVAAFAALLVPASGSSPADTGTVIVSAHDASVLPAGARFVSELGPGLQVFTLKVPAGSTAERYSAQLGRRDGVYAAQPNTRLKLDALSSPCADPPSANTAQNLASNVSALAVTAPGPTAPVAVLDTGVDTAVPELAGRVRTGNYTIDGSADTSDIDGHGTEVAAVVGAKAGRFQGISPTTPIIPIKIYNRNSETTVDWVVKGIDAAVKAGAPFINLSSSNPAADVAAADANVLQQAITAAFAKGTITIVSAGNEGKGDPTVPGKLERVINVGSASADGTRDAYSNFGPWIDLVSPSAGLILPAPPGVCTTGYGTAQGTSFSAPAVSGAAAVIKSLRPTLDTQQMYDLLRMFTVKDLYTPGRDNDSGFGLLSVEEGVNAATPAKQSTEIDDDVYWVKQDRKKHPTYMKATSKTSLKSSVQPGKDPDDVFPVYVQKGRLLTVTATAVKTTSLLSIGIWSRNTGSFDVSTNKTDSLIIDSEGVTNNPRIQYRAKSTGTYYVSVDAPDPPDASDERTSSTVVEPYIRYTLSMTKGKAKKKATKKKKKKKK
jgi:subtilisin family serine protease